MSLSVEKYMVKRAQLIARTAAALQVSEDEAVKLLRIPRTQSMRVNNLVTTASDVVGLLTSAGVKLKPVHWFNDGFSIEEGSESVRDSALAHEGELYIQNAASWLPVLALNGKPGETILDMCAAPGGKTSHIAAATFNKAFITANDNSRPRLLKLQRNLERLQVENVDYLLKDATQLRRTLQEASFDKILLDAPCSGEGMMLLDNKKDFESWSVAHIKRLQQLQKKLIVQAWHLLKPGGTLVYSTCTMAPEENEAVIDYLLRHNDDVEVVPLTTLASNLGNKVNAVLNWNGKHYTPELVHALRLFPSEQVEAFFVVKLRKKEL